MEVKSVVVNLGLELSFGLLMKDHQGDLLDLKDVQLLNGAYFVAVVDHEEISLGHDREESHES